MPGGIYAVTQKAHSGILVSRNRDKRELITLLIKKGGLRIHQSFRLKSGRVSPYFINMGALNDGESLAKLRWVFGSYIALLLEEGLINYFDFVFGPAYKGITLASLTCEGLKEYYGINKRFLYDRKEVKNYGDVSMDGAIVGSEYFRPGQSILIVSRRYDNDGEDQSCFLRETLLHRRAQDRSCVVAVDRQETAEEYGMSAVQYLEKTFSVKIFPILPASEIYEMIKRDLSPEERMACTP
jgi:orotate phosphoribosyltransferase